MKKVIIKRMALLIVVIGSAAWIGLFLWDIIQNITGAQGIVYSAPMGAIFEVEASGLELTSGSGGIMSYDRRIIPSLLWPFLVLVGFGIFGAWALGGSGYDQRKSG